MRIDEAAEHSGLTQDTIRFYEKSAMLPAIARDARGWRKFAPDDLEWLVVLERLRATGMPLDAVKEFAASAQGPKAENPEEEAKRLKLLQDHAETLADRRKKLDACEAYLTHKIAIYSKKLEP